VILIEQDEEQFLGRKAGMELTGKSAIVTGAGRGIGRAIAVRLAREGVNICAVSRTRAEIDNLSEEVRKFGRRAVPVAADVSEETAVRTLIDRAVAELGSVDILVNNAGVGYFSTVKELPSEKFDRMWNVNVRGAFLCSRGVLDPMTVRGGGDIVNIASLAGRNAFIGGAGYAATKWALIGFARCLMLEVRDLNIRVITICPGSVDTSFGDHSVQNSKSKGRIPSADDIASVVVEALKAPRHMMVSEIDIRPTNPKG
jgi:3-oxoacyl-[acyl-carrier protein] reductase